MEEKEQKDFGQLLGENLGLTGEELQSMDTGSNQRLNEAKIFDMQFVNITKRKREHMLP